MQKRNVKPHRDASPSPETITCAVPNVVDELLARKKYLFRRTKYPESVRKRHLRNANENANETLATATSTFSSSPATLAYS